MTNKMKKKRNRILRKRIMRTASALTMVMAITLAAVPVENLGRFLLMTL
jgi:hypothetical protein